MTGIPLLQAKLLYGCGLRLMECLRLRVKDLDFDQRQIAVRDAKGSQDRTTMLPEQGKSRSAHGRQDDDDLHPSHQSGMAVRSPLDTGLAPTPSRTLRELQPEWLVIHASPN
jgi:integrase